jgi:hypothetical protein
LITSGREGQETAVKLTQGQLLAEVFMVAIQPSGLAHAHAHRRSEQVGQGIEFSKKRTCQSLGICSSSNEFEILERLSKYDSHNYIQLRNQRMMDDG